MVAKRVLMIEDNSCVRGAFSRLLEKFGMDVIAFESGEHAQGYLATGQFDFALLDCRLPGRSGPEIAQDITKQWQHVHIVFMSAEDGFRDLAREKCPGAPFLRKPFTPDQLMSLLAE